MKNLIASFILICLIGCKPKTPLEPTTKTIEPSSQQNINNESHENFTSTFSEEQLEFDKEKTKSIKRKQLIESQDDQLRLQELVISKKFYKDEDLYVLDYQYPYLNEEIYSENRVFNTYIKENYLDVEKTENQILEDKELLCNTLKINRFRDKRIIDYKIYSTKNDLISVVLYKENYYSGMKYSTYLFDCLNFDLKRGEFIYFDTFFENRSEEQVYTIINTIIKENINSGELYYDCWELSKGDFNAYKNNFVIDDDMIKYYFDDCVICPSYTGTYYIEIPISKIMHLLKKYNTTPEIG